MRRELSLDHTKIHFPILRSFHYILNASSHSNRLVIVFCFRAESRQLRDEQLPPNPPTPLESVMLTPTMLSRLTLTSRWHRTFSAMPVPSPLRWILPTNLPPVTKTPVTQIKTLPVQGILPHSHYHYDPWADIILQAMNRNNRVVKRANHGSRPCNRRARRNKRRAFGNPSRGRG